MITEWIQYFLSILYYFLLLILCSRAFTRSIHYILLITGTAMILCSRAYTRGIHCIIFITDPFIL